MVKKGTRLLLINPPFPGKARALPLSASYLAGAAASVVPKEDIRILDLNAHGSGRRENLRKTLEKFKPTHAGITRFSPNAKEGMEIIREIKRHNPSILTSSGGPHEAFCGKNTLRMFGPGGEDILDYVASGFNGIPPLYEFLGAEDPPWLPKSIAEVVPAHELLLENVPGYQFEGLFAPRMTQLIASTGCNYSCPFCQHDSYAPARISVVLKSVRKALSSGFGAILFEDLNFISNRRRALELMGEFGKMGFEWGCQTRADSITPKVVQAMASSGCTYVCMGMDPEGLKGIAFRKVAAAARLLKSFGIRVGIYSMLGNAPSPSMREEKTVFGVIEGMAPEFLSLSVRAFYPSAISTARFIGGYEMGAYCREKEWMAFDEGWGAFHQVGIGYALRLQEMLEARIAQKPEIWGNIKRF